MSTIYSTCTCNKHTLLLHRRCPGSRTPGSRPVAHLLCNRQVLRVVLDGLCIVLQILIRYPEGALDKRGNARHRSPHGGCHHPRRAPALPRPASRQHHQAASILTRTSGQPSASLPCGCQHEQLACTRPCARPSTP